MSIAAFLTRHAPLARGDEWWGTRAYAQPLRLTWYRGEEAPPAALITSVRAIVLRAGEVLVVREPDGAPRLVAGGRCEAGETAEETVRREILEEVGWALGPLTPLGFVHLHNLAPRLPGSPYPYPDAFQTIYTAEALTHHPEAMVADDWVASFSFMAIMVARQLPIRAGERALFDVALAIRHCGGA
jgi:8-oxo-dGTP pyrophosphatase MutT (NUDIX family)